MNNTSTRRVLVTGATSDIGMELVKGLSTDTSLILGLHGNNSFARLTPYQDHARCHLLKKDLSTPEAGIELVSKFCEAAGGIDVLIQLSGSIAEPVDWTEITPVSWNRDIAVNLSTPFFMAREAIARMQEGGRIVLMSNAAADRGGGTDSIAYGVAKAGIIRVVKALAKFSAPRGIRVNAVAPGFVDTRFHQEQAGRSPGRIEKRKKSIPLPYPGTTTDVAEAIKFLALGPSQYITGTSLTIDGGDFL